MQTSNGNQSSHKPVNHDSDSSAGKPASTLRGPSGIDEDPILSRSIGRNSTLELKASLLPEMSAAKSPRTPSMDYCRRLRRRTPSGRAVAASSPRLVSAVAILLPPGEQLCVLPPQERPPLRRGVGRIRDCGCCSGQTLVGINVAFHVSHHM